MNTPVVRGGTATTYMAVTVGGSNSKNFPRPTSNFGEIRLNLAVDLGPISVQSRVDLGLISADLGFGRSRVG